MSVGRLCVPDPVVMAREDVATPTPAHRILLVAEITFPSNASTDRIDKLRAYAHAAAVKFAGIAGRSLVGS
ncbi:hypothetical protein ACFRCG_24865 [Embleya sp. NPDC056575]|uniref:hypothetical protein n=1 Tax=unclassified Embleya TaxID=2699296 RepID=UPI0036A1B8C7